MHERLPVLLYLVFLSGIQIRNKGICLFPHSFSRTCVLHFLGAGAPSPRPSHPNHKPEFSHSAQAETIEVLFVGGP